jgi:RNA polymerase sigma factor (sigma-70 family)
MAGYAVTTTDEVSPALAGRSRRWSLVWSQRARLLRIARRRTASDHDAEDVVAEALLRAMESPEIDDERLPAWLTTVTVRLCIDVQRERAREHRLWSRTGAPGTSASCEERVCELSEAAWVSRRLTALPARQAQALRLRADGHDVAGVARSLGVSYRTAESLLARGRAAARSWLVWSLAALAALAERWGRWRLLRVPAVGRAVAVSAGVAAVGVAVATHAGMPHAGMPHRPAAVKPDSRPAAAAVPPGAHRAGGAPARPAPTSPTGSASPGGAAPATTGPGGTASPAAPIAVSPGVPAAGIAQPQPPRVPAVPPVVTAPPRLPAPQPLPSRQPVASLPGEGHPTASAP